MVIQSVLYYNFNVVDNEKLVFMITYKVENTNNIKEANNEKNLRG